MIESMNSCAHENNEGQKCGSKDFSVNNGEGILNSVASGTAKVIIKCNSCEHSKEYSVDVTQAVNVKAALLFNTDNPAV